MGFIKDITTASGLNVRLAYHQISYVEGDYTNISLTLKIYANKKAFDANPDLQPLEIKNYYFEPDNSEGAKNIFVQAQDYLKSLPEYSELIPV